MLDEAAHLVEAVPQLSSRSTVYNEIARRYAEFGEGEKAALVCKINLETISAIRDESRRAVCLAHLAFTGQQAGLDLAEAEGSSLESILTRTAH